MSDLLSWEDWREQYEAHHERLRATVPGFAGYGPRPVVADTGEDCWKDYWREGLTPEDALASDRSYWDE